MKICPGVVLMSFDRYDSCYVGTFPNQTLKDSSGPASALHSDVLEQKYNFQLSVLSGQCLS
jgi:beta-glucan synthesis-associated protein KRE6